MKQVWQAEDGSVFQTELEVETYEDKLYTLERIKEALENFPDRTRATMLRGLDHLIETHPIMLRNYIKAMENKDAN